MTDATKLIVEGLLSSPWNLSRSAQIALFEAAASIIESLSTQLKAAQPKWISAEERLPSESETVLVYRDGCCGVSRLLDVEPGIMWTYAGIGGDPTHWMPLPSVPEEVK